MLTVLFLAEKINRWKLFFKSASLHFSHAWKICILEKQTTEVILVGWFGKCQSIKRVGDRQTFRARIRLCFSFRLARRNVITKRNGNLEPDLGFNTLEANENDGDTVVRSDPRYFALLSCWKHSKVCQILNISLKFMLKLYNNSLQCKSKAHLSHIDGFHVTSSPPCW